MQDQTSPYAPVARRAFARLVDFGLISVPLNALALLALIYARSLPLAVVLLLLEAAYKPVTESRWGYTLGKKWMKMRVVDQETGGNIDMNKSLLRFLPWAVSVFTTIFVYTRHFQDPAFAEVGDLIQYTEFTQEHVLSQSVIISLLTNLTIFSAVWMFSDPMNRALHDRIAKTVVVNDVAAIEKEQNVGW